MAPTDLLYLLFFPIITSLIPRTIAARFLLQSTGLYPLSCVDGIKTCGSLLYQHNHLDEEQIATYYHVNSSQISPFSSGIRNDFLVSVPCSCEQVNGTAAYFYGTNYTVQQNDTFVNVSGQIYSGQAWEVGGEEGYFVEGNEVEIDLLCGCVEDGSHIMVTYTVEQNDTLTDIATLFSANLSDIESYNRILTQNPGGIDVGSVLFVPVEKNQVPPPAIAPSIDSPRRKWHNWTILVSILSAVSIILLFAPLAVYLLRRNRNQRKSKENSKALSQSKSFSSRFEHKEKMEDQITLVPLKSKSFPSRFQHKEKKEVVSDFESERLTSYSLEEIAWATNNFHESRKIGEGGYGSLYYGVIGEQRVAVKKMRSNKEFFAELKASCKINHINVVELLGFATGNGHLYLVHEYIQNGSLSEHLHDPLLKGKQPLSWMARTTIALDAAKGIEYVHDHTRSCCVHRDIKTSNILLTEGLRAKVAGFGLSKLVERSNKDDLIVTSIVGTPGYLPPESVKELQVTTKTDVFAFGVVVAELITGQRALFRDNREPKKMKSLVSVVKGIFEDENPETALESIIDSNLGGNYPMVDVLKMAKIAAWCFSEDPCNRPEMRYIVVELIEIVTSSIEWEASLGGDSHVFSGVFTGR